MRRRAALLAPAAGLALLAAAPAPGAEPVRGPAEVIDGDSLKVAGYEVRLWGIDAPEFKRRCQGHPIGRHARDALAQLVAGTEVACEVRYTDVHTRLVATCRAGGTSLNRTMLRRGWAREIPKFTGGAYKDAARQARQQGRGLYRWACEVR